ncbi:T9SS type A sorting domain-containing protein [Flavobacterium sp.]|uniref:T9SS type A sorting domain-containing protein n=1 Tax=Flavobacterium sp. TaxID=239 RepID=UPI0012271E40|nr:T9SS type A sorting domain-containing protein [Flavobacterium sp.]RZJ70206.1 MAG: T9SS type A sorting domain-containing protein [Flavobacterium sp.]
MKKNYLLVAGFLLFGLVAKSQILNQSAAWPNTAWSVTGSYSTDPLAFEASPLTTANFAFDDDDAGNGHEDNIAAESPIINLTAAFNGGEKNIAVTVDYGYRYFANDQLRLEYWDAIASAWVAWGANIPGNNTSATDNFCAITKTTYTSATLDISNFTPAMLTGFRYRISYDDDPAAADWNYGFCFASPTIKSLSCVTPSGLAVSGVSSTGATITWTSVSGANGYQYVLDTNAANPATGTAITGATYTAASLTPQTQYYFHVRTACTGTNSDWATISFFTAPANDNCSAALALTVNADLACGVTTAGTLQGATDSGVADTGAGTPDDDVWFKFVATATSQVITLSNVAGTPTDLVHEIFSGDCAVLTSLLISDPNQSTVSGLTVGNTYYVRVFTYATGGTPTTTFNICVGTLPAPPANDNCSAAIALTVNPTLTCTTSTAGTLVGATNSGVASTTGAADDDVWFKFVATATTHFVTLSNVAGTPTDLVHQVFSGDCAVLTSLVISDPNASTVTGLTVGNTYYVRVFSYATGGIPTTTFNICVTSLPPAPANDNCSGAVTLTANPDLNCASTATGTLASATDSGVADTGAGTPDDDVWYKFVATNTIHQIAISNVTGTPTDLVHEIFSGDCAVLTSLLISDPNTSTVTGLTVGNTYYVRVFTYATGGTPTTNFTICVGTPPAPPANDDCANAISLNVDANFCTGSNTNGTNAAATNSGVANPSCFNYGQNDVWFKFTVPATTASVNVSTDFTGGTLVDTEIALYSGVCGQLTAIACDQDSGTTVLSNGFSYNSLITDADVTVGQTYFVRVSGYSAASQGTFCLEISTNEQLGTGDLEKDSLKAYPNPVKDILTLENASDISDVHVYNILGQEVISKKIDAANAQIDMSALAKGTYVVKVMANDVIRTIKVIKE